MIWSDLSTLPNETKTLAVFVVARVVAVFPLCIVQLCIITFDKYIYGVIQKKLFKGHFRIMWTAWSKKNFCNGILGQRTISVQIFKIFGCHQNHGY